MEVLVVYQFCSFGGVERMLLSRAIAFRNAQLPIRMSVGYLHDSGALKDFRDFVSGQNLADLVEPFLMKTRSDSILHPEYDLILVVDTPEVLRHLAGSKNVYVECHTPYGANREYLRSIPKNVMGVIVPSRSFGELIQNEVRRLPPVHVISNPVPDEFFGCPVPGAKTFHKRPIAYLARLDGLKNIDEALQVFGSFKDVDDVMFLIVGQGAIRPDILKALKARGIMGKTFLRNSLPFGKVPLLVSTVKAHQGVFFSPSQGESFGLSVAEFMAGGVPVLVSNIPAHKELVDADERFLYELGNIDSTRSGLSSLLENWTEMSALASRYATKFREPRFIREWTSVFGNLQ